MNLQPVKDHDDLARVDGLAIIMTNSDKYEQFMSNYANTKEQKLREATLTESRFQALEETMSEIQDMLKKILGASNAKTQE